MISPTTSPAGLSPPPDPQIGPSTEPSKISRLGCADRCSDLLAVERGTTVPAKFEAFSAYKARLNGKDVRLVSRNQKVFDYRQLLDALKLLPAEHFVLDGEIAALDEKGRPSFQPLQIFKSSGNVPLVCFAFDLLFLDGKDLREQSLSARRKLLAKLLEKALENIRLSGEIRGSKDELLRVAQEFGLEGLVAKRPNSVYESGRRSGAWVKFKITKSQEFVIGGYTSPEGTGKLPRLPAGRLLESRWARLFRQSRIRLLRKTLGKHRRAIAKAQVYQRKPKADGALGSRRRS